MHSLQPGIEGIVYWEQTTAAKETMHFIFAKRYVGNRDNRPQNTCVSSDKLGFFGLSLRVK